MRLKFDKESGLIPAIVQDAGTARVLMFAYMNDEAIKQTRKLGQVTFFSRSRQRLWTKGETSGNYLQFIEMYADCDRDVLLVKAIPSGPVCHRGTDTCFKDDHPDHMQFLSELENIIVQRKTNMPRGSYTTSLFRKGLPKIAQKVGEEATELIIDAVGGNKEGVKQETADLLYHVLVLLQECDVPLSDIMNTLRKRHTKPGSKVI